jgi:spermidine/putrescine ABC transporter ATP-binding subunit
MSGPVVELRGIWKLFGEVDAVCDVSFAVEDGEFVSLLGPSGSGKTTTLRMVAGFERPSAGSIAIAGQDVSRVAAKDRDVSMVFQNYALFPHLTVFENVAFGLRVRRVPKHEIAERAARYLALVQLQGLDDRLPGQLSGGQQQRVALARALVTEPKVLLLDEPLGALDRKLREELQVELKQLLDRVGITALYVTHDQDEALVMSDRVAVMHEGRLEQLDSPQTLYERPRTQFVATFVGTANVIEGTVVAGHRESILDAGDITLGLGARTGSEGRHLAVAIRPEKVRLVGEGDSLGGHSARIVSSHYRGATTQYELETPAGRRFAASVANTDHDRGFAAGEQVTCEFPAAHLIPLDEVPSAAETQDLEHEPSEVGAA